VDYLIQHRCLLDAVDLLPLRQTAAACIKRWSCSDLVVRGCLQLQILQTV